MSFDFCGNRNIDGTVTNGGYMLIPDPLPDQIVYLDFDGELTRYNGEILTVENVEVEDSGLTPERVETIVNELNGRFDCLNVRFVTDRPLDTDYSTIYVGKTSAFDSYGHFAGLAETVDSGNANQNDNAFVMVDANVDDSMFIQVISHETQHLVGVLDHGDDEFLWAYAAENIFIMYPNEDYHNLLYDHIGGHSRIDSDILGLIPEYMLNITIISTCPECASYPVKVINNSDFLVWADRKIEGIKLLDGARMLISSGGTAANIGIDAQTQVEVYSGGIIQNVNIYQNGTLILHNNAVVSGFMNFTGTVNADTNAIVDFSVNLLTDSSQYLINDLGFLSPVNTFTCTVKTDQAPGVYKIAAGATFLPTITLKNTNSVIMGELSQNENLVYGNTSYLLYLQGTDLVLSVTGKDTLDIKPDKPVANADVTGPTNGNVVVSATFSADSAQKQYSLDGENWIAYIAGVAMSSNGKVYFRGINATGNISDVTCYSVSNIDKVAPDAPTVSANITVATNEDVIVSATFSADSAQKQYSLDGENWIAYTAGVVMSTNGELYFRGIDAAGNISDITSYSVSNIDKTVANMSIDFSIDQVEQIVYYDGPTEKQFTGAVLKVPYQASAMITMDKDTPDGEYEFVTSLAEVEGAEERFKIQVIEGTPSYVSLNPYSNACYYGTKISETTEAVTWRIGGISDYVLTDKLLSEMTLAPRYGSLSVGTGLLLIAGVSLLVGCSSETIVSPKEGDADANKDGYYISFGVNYNDDKGKSICNIILNSDSQYNDSNISITIDYHDGNAKQANITIPIIKCSDLSQTQTVTISAEQLGFEYGVEFSFVPKDNEFGKLYKIMPTGKKELISKKYTITSKNSDGEKVIYSSFNHEQIYHCWVAAATNMLFKGGYLSSSDYQACFNYLSHYYYEIGQTGLNSVKTVFKDLGVIVNGRGPYQNWQIKFGSLDVTGALDDMLKRGLSG